MNYELIAVWSQVVCFIAFAVFAVWIWQKAVTPAIAGAQEAQNQRLAELETRLAKMEADREEARALALRAKDEAKLIVKAGAMPVNVSNLIVRATALYQGHPTIHEVKLNVNVVK